MKKKFRTRLLALLLLCFGITQAQNEYKKWYFGNAAGLDFTTNPPTLLTNGAMNANEGCSSISDAAGNLLFYTNGIVIWNKLHTPMANGTGLLSDASASQAGMIVKQPGSTNVYYVFTVDAYGGTNGLRYSVVDMSLAATNGSVTTKNILLYAPTTEKLTAAMHCNGTDIWIISHAWNSADFRCYLLSSSGISPTPVISTIGPVNTIQSGQPYAAIGYIKVSPNGKKIGLARYWTPACYELYDFDNTTGVVSNSLSLGSNFTYAYGCEFSPDGSKFYGAATDAGKALYQWDLCAGSNAAILASRYMIDSTIAKGALQRAPDGKIYVAKLGEQSLGVINNPNAAGALCNYANNGQLIAPAQSRYGLPNSPLLRPAAPPFTYTGSACTSYSFNVPPIQNLCIAAGFSLVNVSWSFGDPGSAAANSSSLNNPVHNFSSPGTFTVQLVLNYSCGGGSDTLKQVITTGGAAISIAGQPTVCAGESATLTANGAVSYSWSTGALTATIAVAPLVTTAYTVTGTNSSTACVATGIFTLTVDRCTGITEADLNATLLSVYPIPGNDYLFVETGKAIRLLIYNSIGEIILSSSFPPGKHTIDIRSFSNGIYTLKAIDNIGSKNLKLVKTD